MSTSAQASSAAVSGGTLERTQRIVDLAGDDEEDDGSEDQRNEEAAGGGGGGKMKGEDGDGDGDEEGCGEGEGEGEGFEGNGWEEGEVEWGMLHALVELGHLEMLLHQVRGGGEGGGEGAQVCEGLCVCVYFLYNRPRLSADE